MIGFYRVLLVVLPSAFRAEYGSEMLTLVRDRRQDEPGLVAQLRLAAELIPDLLSTAFREHLEATRRDVNLAVRSFLRSPLDPAIIVLTLALGLGANVALLTALDHVLVRPLPFPDADRLVQLWESAPLRGYREVQPSPGTFRDWEERTRALETLAAHTTTEINLTGGDGPPERLASCREAGRFFTLLAPRPVLGRVLDVGDQAPDATPVVVISEGLWQRRFGGRREVLDATLDLDGEAHRIVGVLPRTFSLPHRETDLWLPLRETAVDWTDRADHFLNVMARLRPGTTLAAAQADLDRVSADLAREFPETNRGSEAFLRPLRDEISGRRGTSLVLSGLAALGVLGIAAANLAGLSAARARRREGELTLRTALGAGREHLIRQLLTENVLLLTAGTALGLLLGAAALPALAHLIPDAFAVDDALRIDGRILGATSILATLTGFLSGWWPAWRITRRTSALALASSDRSGRTRSGHRFYRGIVVLQVAVATILLLGTALLLRGLATLSNVDPGFQSEDVLTLRSTLAGPQADDRVVRQRFYDDVLRRVRALPGVESAGFAGFLPFTMRGIVWPVGRSGDPTSQEAPVPLAVFREVTEGYLETLRIPLLDGRLFDARDEPDALRSAVVSASFARRIWPDVDPLGRQIEFLWPWLEGETWTVVGVVGDIRARALDRDPLPQVYVLHRQTPGLSFHAPRDLAVRSELPPESLAPELRRILGDVAPDQPVSDLRPLQDIVDAETTDRAHQAGLLASFAALAALLAALGVYGSLSLAVARRRRELGIRRAVGASTQDILSRVLRSGLGSTVLGALVGISAGLVLAPLFRHVVFGVPTHDPRALLATGGGALLLGVLASIGPAWRALRVDPVEVLRPE